MLFLPVFLALTFLISMGSGLFVAALNVKYRDFKYIVPFVVQIGMYVSPVGFSSSVVPQKYRLLYSLNPMAGAIDGFRWCILGNKSAIYMPGLLVSIGITFLLVFIGIWYFRKMEKTFADVV